MTKNNIYLSKVCCKISYVNPDTCEEEEITIEEHNIAAVLNRFMKYCSDNKFGYPEILSVEYKTST